jgi:pimeloyl-ACP methyl ester carboxylesterase
MTNKLILLHGLEGSSQGFKARYLRERFPHIITPDFHGTLQERMQQLAPILGDTPGWTIIGSSFGGLMGALFTCQHPDQVNRLILLAPALHRPDFAEHPPAPVATPTTIYHAQQDTVVPIAPVHAVAEQVFQHLTFHVVDDDHRLQATMQTIDWHNLLA